MKLKGRITNRTIWLLVIVLWALVLLFMVGRRKFYEEKEIVEAFMQLPYSQVTSKAESFGRLPGHYLLEEEREKLVKEIASMLGITAPYRLEKSSEEGVQTVILCKPSKEAVTTISYQAKEADLGNLEKEVTQYLSVTIELSSSIDSAVYYREMLERISDVYNIEGHTALSFTGRIAGNLSLKDRNKLAEQLIDDISGKVVRQFRSEELFTIYGYSRQMKEYEEVSGEKLNFNLAIAYDEEAEMTEVYLATPYLMEDY